MPDDFDYTYRRDGYEYYTRFGDNFRYRIDGDNAIVDNIQVRQSHLNIHLKEGYNNFIFNKCNFTEIQSSEHFFKTMIFRNCTFNNRVYFLNTTFHKQVIFDNCVFKSNIIFANNKFMDKVSFENSTFYNAADFNNVSFSGTVSFNNSLFFNVADFNNANFISEVAFNNTSFNNKAIFTNAHFNKQADFSKIKANSGFYFENNNKTPDTAEIIFDNAKFDAPIFFNGRCFKEKISFTNTLINNTFNFTDVDFGSKAVLTSININYENIPDAELWINIFKDNIKNNYLLLANHLHDLSKQLFKDNSRYIDNQVTKEDENILISRKDTSAMLGIPINTLKTWTSRGTSKLVFKTENNQCGYTLASIKEYKKAIPIKNKIKDSKQDPIINYATIINSPNTVTYKDTYVEVTRKMHGGYFTHIPIIEKKSIVGTFSLI